MIFYFGLTNEEAAALAHILKAIDAAETVIIRQLHGVVPLAPAEEAAGKRVVGVMRAQLRLAGHDSA